jgi:hypothetical protein
MVDKNFDIFISEYNLDMSKLLCTFTEKNNINETISVINNHYSILFNKIFILEIKDSPELICTYNIETGNMNSYALKNTISVHRKKDYNTLYSINALNILIKQLNNNILDTRFPLNWEDYRNCLLLTNGSELRRLDTSLNQIITL